MKTDTAWRWAVVGVGVIAATGLWRMGTQSAEAQRAAGGPCCCVATLDLPLVLQNLDERAERETELQGFIKERLDRIDQIKSRIEQLGADLQILPQNSSEWLDKREEILRAEVEQRNEENFLNLRGSETEARMKRDLFNKIRDAAARYAEREGIAIVVSNDSSVEIPEPLSPDLTRQVEPAIVSRRVIHSSACADISEDVARMMNVEFQGR